MMLMRALLQVISTVLFLFPVAFSVEFEYSAEDCGKSIGITSNYESDTNINVRDGYSGSFYPMSIENVRFISGTGNANAVQSFYGYTNYAGNSYIHAKDASIDVSTNSYLTPEFLAEKLVANINGGLGSVGMDILTENSNVNTDSWMDEGLMRTFLVADTCIAGLSQISDIDAEKGGASSSAERWQSNGKHNNAETSTNIERGLLHTVQSANSNHIAEVYQVSDSNAKLAIARSSAGQMKNDASANFAATYAQIENGNLETKQISKDDGSANVVHISTADAENSRAETYAGYKILNLADNQQIFGHPIKAEASIFNGLAIISQYARDDGSVAVAQEANINAISAILSSTAQDSTGKYATTNTIMTEGNLVSRQMSKVDSKISVSQNSNINAYIGTTSSYITDDRNNLVGAWCDVFKGSLNVANLKATDEKETLSASGETSIIPDEIDGHGMAFAYANYALCLLEVDHGTTLHAAIRSELIGDMPYAEIVPCEINLDRV